jgi:hypothetical protein
MIATQLLSALILSVHLVAPSIQTFTVELLEAGMLTETVIVERRGPVYRYRSDAEPQALLFEVERSGLYGQFFTVFEPGEREPRVVDLSEQFAALVDLPVERDAVRVLQWRVRRSRGAIYIEIPDITSTLVIHSDAPVHGWIVEPPREPWAR